MTQKELKDILLHKLYSLERAKYKGEFGTPEDESLEYVYYDGYTDALRYVLIQLGINAIEQNKIIRRFIEGDK